MRSGGIGNDPLNVGIDAEGGDSDPKAANAPARSRLAHGDEHPPECDLLLRDHRAPARSREEGCHLQSIDDQLPGQTVTRIVVAQR
jgi:hypothetical protein